MSPMITKGAPCEKCGCNQWMTAIDTSDPDAEELAMYSVCVRCRHSPDKPKPQET